MKHLVFSLALLVFFACDQPATFVDTDVAWDITGTYKPTETEMEVLTVDQEFTLNPDKSFSYTIYEMSSTKVKASGKGKWQLGSTVGNGSVFLKLTGYNGDNVTLFKPMDRLTLMAVSNDLFSMGAGQVFTKPPRSLHE